MKEFVINDDDLKEEDIEMRVIRVKALILNSKGNILLAFNNNTYQFPGGHVDDGEDIDECIKREIKEEVGIDVKVIKKMYEYKDEKSSQLFYLVEQTGGVFGTGEGPEFITPNPNKEYYHMEMISFEDISKINLVPEEIKIKLIENIKLNRV